MEVGSRLFVYPFFNEIFKCHFGYVFRQLIITDELIIGIGILIYNFFHFWPIKDGCLVNIILRGLSLRKINLEMFSLKIVEVIIICFYLGMIGSESPFIKLPHSIA